jgi:hypothetical protein
MTYSCVLYSDSLHYIYIQINISILWGAAPPRAPRLRHEGVSEGLRHRGLRPPGLRHEGVSEGLRHRGKPPPTTLRFPFQFLYLLHLLHTQLLFRFLILLSWREYVSFLSALMQQIKIPNMTANDPAMTISSPMNAGILVWIRIESWDWCWYLSSYMTGFLHSIFWGAVPPQDPPPTE